jgi:hypothetical protein
MKKLAHDGFDLARDFLLSEGRPLEKEMFRLEFGEGSVNEVLTQLAAYQNADGGFGHALEPDVRTPSSSALCTEIGLRMLAELHTPADHPVVAAAVKYALDTLDPETKVWRVVSADNNDHPHAPWWHDDAGSLARTFDDFRVIPRAGILAVLYHYAELVPADWLTAVIAATLADIKMQDVEKFGGGGDALVYTRRLAEASGLPADIKVWLIPRAQEIADQIVAREPVQWTQYCAPPLKLAPTLKAVTAEVLNDCIPAHLDYLIKSQSPEGYWEVTWSWGDFYPDDWPQAKQEWRSDLTLTTLITLKAFGRINT